jgi:hypothetical protein
MNALTQPTTHLSTRRCPGKGKKSPGCGRCTIVLFIGFYGELLVRSGSLSECARILNETGTNCRLFVYIRRLPGRSGRPGAGGAADFLTFSDF